jgi:hypothetical protein
MVTVLMMAAVGSSGGCLVRAVLRFFLRGGRALAAQVVGCCPLVVVLVVVPLRHPCPHPALCSLLMLWHVVFCSASTVGIGWSQA